MKFNVGDKVVVTARVERLGWPQGMQDVFDNRTVMIVKEYYESWNGYSMTIGSWAWPEECLSPADQANHRGHDQSVLIVEQRRELKRLLGC